MFTEPIGPVAGGPQVAGSAKGIDAPYVPNSWKTPSAPTKGGNTSGASSKPSASAWPRKRTRHDHHASGRVIARQPLVTMVATSSERSSALT
jgi:hypothetical protein